MSAIYKAAKAGDVREMNQLVEQGADPDFRDEKDGRTPLMAACLSEKAGVDAVRLLLEWGADVNATAEKNCDLGKSILALAVQTASIDKIELLLKAGAKVDAISLSGYTLLIHAAYANRMDVFERLLEAGAPLDGESGYKETALGVLCRNGRFPQIGRLLEMGADQAPLKWMDLHKAVALGHNDDIAKLLDEGADIEGLDGSERTPFLLAILTGDTGKTRLLLDRGADSEARGKCRKTALQYAAELNDVGMTEWLVAEGCDFLATDQFGYTALMTAVEYSAEACFDFLIGAGADWEKSPPYDDSLIATATHPGIIHKLMTLGANPAELEDEELRKLMGIEITDELPVTKEQFLEYRTRRFGRTNPELVESEYWEAMVRNGWSGFQAGEQFGMSSYDDGVPEWSHQRFGMSLTILPDGRFVQIAGEHEDGYDPDFCIYNDVFVHDGKGGLKIYTYPKEVFPPTDFHSATFVDPWIYVIGNLSYPEIREEFDFKAPVFRLDTETWKMERVLVKGESPGWVHGHHAELVGDGIRISGGKVQVKDEKGDCDRIPHKARWVLDLVAMEWRKCKSLPDHPAR